MVTVSVSNVIFFIHVVIMIAGFVVPFTSNPILLRQYSLVIPFLMFHWSINDDTCALTIMEQYARGEMDKKKTFTGQVMNKIYILPDDLWGKFLKTSYFTLWLMVQYRLGRLL